MQSGSIGSSTCRRTLPAEKGLESRNARVNDKGKSADDECEDLNDTAPS
jgi:hypothetical protein